MNFVLQKIKNLCILCYTKQLLLLI